jgi:hypothetical protein|tara:strand:- start:1985 stop:2185 length:201 start_codon:yes stop_codon:yes gene_type:complete
MVEDKDIDKVGRTVALRLQQLMAVAEFEYNRHQPCIVCGHKYSKHEDGLPCISDDERKVIRDGRKK